MLRMEENKILPCAAAPRGLAPRVTEVIRVVQPDGLLDWKVRAAVRHALTNWHEYDPDHDIELFLDRKMPEYMAAINGASERNRAIGNELHALTAIRDSGQLVRPAAWAHAMICANRWYDFASENVERFLGIEQPVSAELGGLWYTGTYDRLLVWKAGTKLGVGAEPLPAPALSLVDFKYSESGKFYAEWAMQIAAYAHAAGHPDALAVSVRFYPDGRNMAVKNWGPASQYLSAFENRLRVWYDLNPHLRG